MKVTKAIFPISLGALSGAGTAHAGSSKSSKSTGGFQCKGVYTCDGFILRYKDEMYDQLQRNDKFVISMENPSTSDPLEPGFFMMTRNHDDDAEKDDDPALCAIKPWDDDSAICAETTDTELMK